MADNSFPTRAGDFEQQFDRKAGMIRVAVPGVIQSFDPDTQRVTAIPAIQMKTMIDGIPEYKSMPEILNVPIVLPMAFGGKVAVTFPINSGDPCLLIFADRSISNFLQSGQEERPGGTVNEKTTKPRSHSLTDAICIPGLSADPQALPDWNNQAVEMRTQDRKLFISLDPAEGIAMTDGEATLNMKEGKFDLVAPKGANITAEQGINLNAAQGITMTDGQATVIIKDGKMSVDAPAGVDTVSKADITMKSSTAVRIESENNSITGDTGIEGTLGVSKTITSGDTIRSYGGNLVANKGTVIAREGEFGEGIDTITITTHRHDFDGENVLEPIPGS